MGTRDLRQAGYLRISNSNSIRHGVRALINRSINVHQSDSATKKTSINIPADKVRVWSVVRILDLFTANADGLGQKYISNTI